MLAEESCKAEDLQGFHDIWCSALTLVFLSEWLVKAEEGAGGDGVGYTAGTGDPLCHFETHSVPRQGTSHCLRKSMNTQT